MLKNKKNQNLLLEKIKEEVKKNPKKAAFILGQWLTQVPQKCYSSKSAKK